MRLASRLRALEKRVRMRLDQRPVVTVSFASDALECHEHQRCVIDRETGVHCGNVIQLRF
jgi:hypothetical protein